MRRLLSIDALRGMTVAAMILVNNPGRWSTTYAPLLHAEWNGWTPTDLVFPFFLFLVGVSVSLAYQHRIEAGSARGPLVGKLLRRTVVLFGLGLFLAAFPFYAAGEGLTLHLATIRIPGVLQRIALCYCGAALLFLFTRARTQAMVCVVCLLGYWAAMELVPVPGYGAGMIDGKDTHLAAWIDRMVLGGHLWRNAVTWDPEGILSTVPALATTLLGVATGRLLLAGHPPTELVARLFVRGSGLVVLGYVWSWFFPINKSIWTSSYAVFTAGLAISALALATWVVDVRGRTRWVAPLAVYGKNAIAVFVGSGVLARTLRLLPAPTGDTPLRNWIFVHAFDSWLPPHAASLGFALTWVVGWFGVLWLLDRRGIVIKV